MPGSESREKMGDIKDKCLTLFRHFMVPYVISLVILLISIVLPHAMREIQISSNPSSLTRIFYLSVLLMRALVRLISSRSVMFCLTNILFSFV